MERTIHPRPVPPPVANPAGQGYYQCPLCAENLKSHRFGELAALTCGCCSAYWLEFDVIQKQPQPGHWDDCGVPCNSSQAGQAAPGSQGQTCILGMGHAEDQKVETHISETGDTWTEVSIPHQSS